MFSGRAVSETSKIPKQNAGGRPDLDVRGSFVSAASDVHDEGPVVGLHEHAGGLRARRVVGGGAAPVRTLHAAARRLLHALFAVVTLLKRHRSVVRTDSNIVHRIFSIYWASPPPPPTAPIPSSPV